MAAVVDIEAPRAPPNIQTIKIGGTKPRADDVVKAIISGSRRDDNVPSRQIEVEEAISSISQGVNIIPPLEDPYMWSLAVEQNTRLLRSIRLRARNTVGLGVRIVAQDDMGEDIEIEKMNNADRDRFEMERKQLARVFKFPNDRMPFNTLMELGVMDEESQGQGYLEVLRKITGRISSIYHVPGYTLRRVRGMGAAFVQARYLVDPSVIDVRGGTRGHGQKKFFKEFGITDRINNETGEKSRGRLAFKKHASELIQMRLHTPRSVFYGVPRFVAAAPAISGNRLSAERNVIFFENDATPRALVTVSGGRLAPESVDDLRDFFETNLKGVENSNRVAVLQVDSAAGIVGSENKVEIKYIPITVGINEDASHLAYRAANDEEIREAMGLAEIFFRGDMSNRASAVISRMITNEQEFEPDRVDKEFLLNNTIVSDPHWEGGPMQFAKLRFKRPTVSDPVEKANIDAVYASIGVKGINEIRQDLGMEPFPPEFEFAQKPLVWALAELSRGLTEILGAESEDPEAGDPSGEGRIRPNDIPTPPIDSATGKRNRTNLRTLQRQKKWIDETIEKIMSPDLVTNGDKE